MNTITKINLSNLKKCNQIWDHMPKNEKGRLCEKCSHTIIDFRNFTDAEVAKTHLFSEQKVCGLYSKKQLQKPKQTVAKLPLNKWNSFYFGLFSFLSLPSFGQDKAEPVKTEQTEKKFDSIFSKMKSSSHKKRTSVRDSIVISGTVTDLDSNPLPFANVVIKGTDVGTTSDFNGFYRLNITKELDSIESLTLRYTYVGFETTEITIDKVSIKEVNNRTINIVFNEGEIIEFVVEYRMPFHKRVWYGIKNIFRGKK